MYLFFDTETTGLPKNWNAPASDTRNWPRMVQLAYGLYEADGKQLERRNFIIKPEGFTIPFHVVDIHGISTERAMVEGSDLTEVLADFQSLMERTKYLVAHNIAFDEKILGAEYYRKTGKNPLKPIGKFCTMKDPKIINYCKILPKKYGNYKWPTLGQLHYKLFDTSFENAHDASADIEATAQCFWELRRLNII